MALDKRQLKEAVLTYTEVTSNTILESGKGYIANLNSGGVPLELTLPESFNIGDEITIVGKGSEGWVVKSNALATTQAIVSSQGTSSFSDEDSIILASSVSSTDSLSLAATTINSIFNIFKMKGSVIGSNSFGKIYLGSEGQFRYNETSSQLEYKDTTAGNYTALASSSPSTPQMVIGIDSISKDFVLPLGSTQDISLSNEGLLDAENSSWSVTGDLNVPRYNQGCGTQNAALSFGGRDYTYGSVATTEKFNGAIWTETGNLNTARWGIAATGTQTAALSCGGVDGLAAAEKFNGEIWTETTDMLTGRYTLAGSGTQNASLLFGGYHGLATTEMFNNDVWSSAAGMIIGRESLGGCGTQNAALALGGLNVSYTIIATTEKYNGTAWLAGADLSTVRNELAGTGTQNASLAIAGSTDGNNSLSITEKYNGTVWSSTGPLNQARRTLGGAGSQNAALSIGGYNSGIGPLGNTEKYNSAVQISSKFFIISDTTITETNGSNVTLTSDDNLSVEYDIKQYINADGSNELTDLATLGKEGNDNYWAVTESLNVGRIRLAGVGTQGASLAFGGTRDGGSQSLSTEKFNRDSWAVTGSLNAFKWGGAGAGSQNAALAIGSELLGILVEKFDGASWKFTGNLLTPKSDLGASGTQNAALAFGGKPAYLQPVTADTVKFNGSVWAATGDLMTATSLMGSAGTQNAALSFGGNSTLSYSTSTEKFNINTWSITGSLNVGREKLSGNGLQNAALAFGGVPDGTGILSKVTEMFNGTTWSVNVSLNTARAAGAGSGSQNVALSFGGYLVEGSDWSSVTEKRISSQTPSTTNYGMTLQGDIIIAI